MTQEVQRLRDRVEELEEILGLRPRARPFGLSKKETAVFNLLMRWPVMSRDVAFAAIWGADSEINFKIIDVVICDVRRKLRPFGLSVEREWGTGYLMPAESKALAHRLLAAMAPASAVA